MDKSNISQEFEQFHADRARQSDVYEVNRQRFLRLLHQNKMSWHRTNEILDLDVDISRIYRRDRNEFLAFMRIKPCGFRCDRVVPANKELIFHVLIGSVSFTHKSRTRIMNKGNSVIVKSNTSYSIRCLSNDQPAILIFRLQKLQAQSNISCD